MGYLNHSCESRKKSYLFYVVLQRTHGSDLMYHLHYSISEVLYSERRKGSEQEGIAKLGLSEYWWWGEK